MKKSDEELLAEATTQFAKRNNSTGGSPSCVVKVGPNYTAAGTGCYGGMKTGGAISGDVRFLIIGVQNTDKMVESDFCTYVDYLMNRSPLSEGFVDKDSAECFAKKQIVLDVNVPGNLMLMCAFAVRMSWEKAPVMKSFVALKEAGVEENTAFLFCQAMSFTFSGGEPLLNFGRGSGGHCAIFTDGYSLWDCKRFLTNKPAKNSPPYKKSYSCSGVHSRFGTGYEKGKDSLLTFINNHYEVKGTEDHSKNPFRKAQLFLISKQRKNTGSMKYDHFKIVIKNVVEMVPEFNKAMEGVKV